MNQGKEDSDPQNVLDGQFGFDDRIASSQVTDGDLAEEVLVHGLLRDQVLRDSAEDEHRVAEVMNVVVNTRPTQTSEFHPETMPKTSIVSSRQAEASIRKPRRIAFVSLTAALATSLLLMFTLARDDSASASIVSLEKLIEVARRSVDRSYRVVVVEEYSDKELRRNAYKKNRGRNQDQISGAVIHIRGLNEFVFVRRMSDGRQRVSGCDGIESWAFHEDGAVHVSSDLSRFRSGLPGREQDLPFVNLHASLQQLNEGYEIELVAGEIESSDGRKLSELVATRKSYDVRGPNEVVVWFDKETGVVYQMLLDRLPRRGGGPKSVRLDLLNPEDLGQTDFGPDFFSHDSHHEPFREVRYEVER